MQRAHLSRVPPPHDAQGRLPRRDWLLGMSAAALLAACGGGEGDSSTDAPLIQEFAAERETYFVGDQAQLRVRFQGASGHIDGIGAVRSGVPITTPALSATRRLRLTVETPGHAPATRELQLDVGFRDRWVPLAPFVVNYHATSESADGAVLVFGGSRLASILSNDVDRFDPATRRFERIGRMAATRSNHRAVRLANGHVLVVGGISSDNVWPFAELIDERSGAVTHAGDLVQPRNWHAAVALADGRVLVVGGNRRDSVELWDPATRRWRLVAARMAHDREHCSATLLPDGRVLICGGRSLAERYVFAELFDPRTETFTPVDAAITLRRQFHSAHATDDGRVLILGGEDFRNGIEPLTEVLRYNPAIDSFTGLAPLGTARTLAASVWMPGNEVLLVGGQTPDVPATPSAAAWRADRQRPLAAMPGARQWHTANRLGDGRLLVLGGEDGAAQYVPQPLLYE